MTLPQAKLGKKLKNRLRIYIPEKRKSSEYFSKLKASLSQVEGVGRVDTNPLTGSVLIQYFGDISKVIEYAQMNHLFALERGALEEEVWISRMFREVDNLDMKISASTDGNFNLASIAGVVFIGLGGVQVYRGQILPVASALFLYAAQFLVIAKNKAIRTPGVGIRFPS